MAKKNNNDNRSASKNERRAARKENKYTWKHQLLKLPLLLLIPLGLFLPKLAAKFPDTVESVYSEKIYPVIAKALGFLSSLCPLSVAELIILFLGLLLVLILIIRILRVLFGKLANRKRNRIRCISYILSLCVFVGVMLNLFYCLWGFNHYRYPVSKLMDLEVRKYSVEELESLCRSLAADANELRGSVAEDDRGVFTIGDKATAMNSVVNAYERLGSENSLFDNNVYPTKTVIHSTALSKLDIVGIYIPYTAEANVNIEQPDLYVLSGAAHETAHYFGFAREDEANFLAYLVSLYSGDVSLRYSATMFALSHVANQLYSADADKYFEMREEFYSDGMIRDLSDYTVYYKKYEDHPAKKVNDTINDSYLKYDGQIDGIRSYGRMVDLLLAYYLSNHQ